MPVTTDTYFSMKRLHWIFALSAVALAIVMIWAVADDYDKDWRKTQRSARAWDTELTRRQLQRAMSPEQRARLDDLSALLKRVEAVLDGQSSDAAPLVAEIARITQAHRATLLPTERERLAQIAALLSDPARAGEIEQYRRLSDEIRQLGGQITTRQFKLSGLKSEYAVAQKKLEEARALGGADAIAAAEAIVRAIDARAASGSVAKEDADLWELKRQQKDLRDRRAHVTQPIDDLRRLSRRLGGEIDQLNKRLQGLAPEGTAGRMSESLRSAPLMGFVNPTERVRQQVLGDILTDVSFMKITTVDRCTSCHINIDRPEYSRDRVIAFLEEQLLSARGIGSPARPGPAAHPRFFHGWARVLAPEAVNAQSEFLDTLTGSVGLARARYKGKAIESLAWNPAADAPTAQAQDALLLALIDAWQRYDGKALNARVDAAEVDIPAGLAPDQAAGPRRAAMAYPAQLAAAMREKLGPQRWELLRERYRVELIARTNEHRTARGLDPLDHSPALLAHPRLDLYATADSPHPLEGMGCTSCHDGSGQETDFVLAAHTPRDVEVDRDSGAPMLPGTQGAYTDPADGSARQGVPQAQYWKRKYEANADASFATVQHMWDWPMRRPEYIEAACARCHVHIDDVRDEAPKLYAGKSLFLGLGCGNCHAAASLQRDPVAGVSQVRKVGADLTHLADKLSAQFLDTWLLAPRAFRPTARMPHFFMLENSSSGPEIRRAMQESLAMRTYLVQVSTPATPSARSASRPAEESSEAQRDAIARGRALFMGVEGSATNPSGITEKMGGVGCIGCHTNLNEVGQKWIVEDLAKRGELSREMGQKLGKSPSRKQLQDEALKRFRAMSYQQRHQYAREHFADPLGQTRRRAYADGSPIPVLQLQGPELSGVGSKLLADRPRATALNWLQSWLLDPRQHAADTAMPRMRLSPQEALDLAEYLLAQQRGQDWSATAIQPDSAMTQSLLGLFLRSQAGEREAQRLAGDETFVRQMTESAFKTQLHKNDSDARSLSAAMDHGQRQRFVLGQKLIAHYGCMNCHVIPGMEQAASPCADLSDWGQKRVDRLDFGYHDPGLREQHPAGGSTRMPAFNADDAEAVVRAMKALNSPGGAGALTTPVDLRWPVLEHTRESWLEQKLRNPRIYDRGRSLLEPTATSPGKPYDKLRMPHFGLREEQIGALVTFVISNRDRLVSERLLARSTSDESRRLAVGRRMAEQYNCVGCHRIETNQPSLQQYWLQGFFDKGEMAAKSAPSLRGEGARVHQAWLFNFLKDVAAEGTPSPADGRMRIRPQPFVRMPDFVLTDEEATVMSAYFTAVGTRESRQLQQLIAPLLAEARADAGTLRPEDQLWPADDWHRRLNTDGLAAHGPIAERLRAWALENTLIKEAEFAPDNPPEALDKTFKLALYDARFAAGALPARYPFTPILRTQLKPTDDRFRQGERLFHYLQCQSCHVIGGETDPRVNPGPKGPNLSLLQRRIVRDWAGRWVQESQSIQPGNPMPAIFFSGRGVPAITDPQRSIYAPGGLPHLTSAPTPELTLRIQREFGGTVDEQRQLLLDFIFAASLHGYTSPNPPEGEPRLRELPATRPGTRPADLGLPAVPGITAPLP